MLSEAVIPARQEFYLPELDNLVLVENRDGAVVIRATRDNFSERRKAFFIRELAAEGHIPDRYEWFAESGADEFLGVQWIVDRSWLKLDAEMRRRTTRFMRRLLLATGGLWLVIMTLVLLSSRLPLKTQ